MMKCITPRLTLPSDDEFGNITAAFRIGFALDGVEEYRELDEEKHSISTQVTILHPLLVKQQEWSDYDESEQEPLALEVKMGIILLTMLEKLISFQISWGVFQHEVKVTVSGVLSEIRKRYDNLIMFVPPNEEEARLSQKAFCHSGPSYYKVEVSYHQVPLEN